MLVLVFTGVTSYSQGSQPASKDTSITFKVHGACIQCKNRIEAAVKGKGIRAASWDIEDRCGRSARVRDMT